MRCLEHIPTGMVLLDTSKAFSCTKCIIHPALQLCQRQIETYPCFTADTDTSIMPRSHSASPERTQMPWSCTTDHLFKVIQMTGHPHPTFSTNLSSHRQGYLTTPMQTWIVLYLCSKEALSNTGINIDLLSDRYNRSQNIFLT